MSQVIIKDLKIGRNTYDITTSDQFMDNGKIIQLLTQSNEIRRYGGRYNPVLSINAQRTLRKFNRVQIEHEYGYSVDVFSIAVKE